MGGGAPKPILLMASSSQASRPLKSRNRRMPEDPIFQDCEMVKEKYGKTFQEVLATVSVLEFKKLSWGEEEFKVLSEALPACQVHAQPC